MSEPVEPCVHIEKLRTLAADPIFAFLLGEDSYELDGGTDAWFGDDIGPRYWWRQHVRAVRDALVECAQGES